MYVCVRACLTGAFSNDTSADPSLKVAVRNALTHGFGTAAFAGAILFLIATLRQVGHIWLRWQYV